MLLLTTCWDVHASCDPPVWLQERTRWYRPDKTLLISVGAEGPDWYQDACLRLDELVGPLRGDHMSL